jgi:hypothetical protein
MISSGNVSARTLSRIASLRDIELAYNLIDSGRVLRNEFGTNHR